jgi:hypothetical protein
MSTTDSELRAKVEKLQAFKDWVHAYLDAHGVPRHPPGTHGAEGCRIGDRMDWLMARLRAAEARPADDGEPVTEEWLRAVGATGDRPLRIEHLNIRLVAYYLEGWCSGHARWDWWLNGNQIPAQPTRGHVRRLCAALGVPLNE